jgi:hypothetical protein
MCLVVQFWFSRYLMKYNTTEVQTTDEDTIQMGVLFIDINSELQADIRIQMLHQQKR